MDLCGDRANGHPLEARGVHTRPHLDRELAWQTASHTGVLGCHLRCRASLHRALGRSKDRGQYRRGQGGHEDVLLVPKDGGDWILGLGVDRFPQDRYIPRTLVLRAGRG